MNKKLILFVLSLIILSSFFSSCATIINGSRQPISISSSPSGAKITIDGIPTAATPFIAKLKRRDYHFIKIEMDGYLPSEILLARKVSGWIAGNIVFGGLVGLILDVATGSMYRLTPEQVWAELKPGITEASLKDGIYIGVTLTPDANWDKIGQLERAE
ncbi:hypothetical protein BH23BAC1_BH23BAC1_21270 [soil metagenome]